MRVAEGGVGDGHGLLRAEPGGETVGTERGELLARPVRDRTRAGSTPGNLSTGSTPRGRGPFGLFTVVSAR